MMIFQQPKKFKVLLIGDSCIDEYQYGTVTRISPEAPVPVFKYKYAEERPGMACNVQNNLEALGCEVKFLTGNPSRKIRLVDLKSGHHIARIDHDVTQHWPLRWTPDTFGGCDAVVISDYDKGLITVDMIQNIIQQFDGPVYIDTKKPDLAKFEGAFVKINSDEYNRVTSECTDLIVTMGGEGAKYRGVVYTAPKVSVYDVVGAGDVFLAALAHHHLDNGDIRRAIQFANHAAAVSVKHAGVYTLTSEDIDEIRRVCGERLGTRAYMGH